MPLATLSIDLEARLAKLEAGLSAAQRANDKAAAQMEARWRSLAASARGFGQAIFAGFSVGGLVAAVRSTINALDDLNDASDATGATVENLSALENVARANGDGLELVTASILKLNQALNEAQPDNKIGLTLKALGLSVDDLKSKDPALALQDVAVALAKFADDGDKARAILTLTGRATKDIAHLLADMAKQGQLSASVMTDQAAEAEKFNKQMFAARTAIQDAARALLSDFLPTFNKFAEEVRKNGGVFETLKNAFQLPGQARAAEEASKALQKVVGELTLLDTLQKAGGGTAETTKRMTELRAKADELSQAAQGANAQLQRTLNGGKEPTAAPPPPPAATDANKPSLHVTSERDVKAAEAAAKAYDDLIAKVNERLAASRAELETGAQLTSAQKFALDVTTDMAKAESKLNAAQQATVKSKLDEYLATSKTAEAAKQYRDLVARISERASGQQQELATGQQLSEQQQFEIEVLKDLSKAESQLSDAQKQAIAARLAAFVQDANSLDRQRERTRLIQDETRALAAQIAQQTLNNRGLAEAVEEIGLNADEVERLHIARLENVLALQQEKVATLELFGATEDELSQMRIQNDLLANEISLRRQQAARKQARANDPNAGLQDAVKDYADQAAKLGDSTYHAVSSQLDGLEDRLADFFVKGKADWAGYFEAIAAEALKLNVLRPLISWSATTLLAGFAKGGVFGAGGVTPFASGGVVGSPTLFRFAGGTGLMGEAGPEAIMPLQRGKDGRLGVRAEGAGAGGSVVVELGGNTYHVGQGVSMTQVAAMVQAGNAQTEARIKRLMRQGRFS